MSWCFTGLSCNAYKFDRNREFWLEPVLELWLGWRILFGSKRFDVLGKDEILDALVSEEVF